MTIYEKHGFKNRREYLEDLSDTMGVDMQDTLMLAELLGPDEDFDGLVTMLEDHSGGWL